MATIPPAIYGFDLDLANAGWLTSTAMFIVLFSAGDLDHVALFRFETDFRSERASWLCAYEMLQNRKGDARKSAALCR
ncbi:MAG: hypothetical protein ACOCWR_02900 [Oceanidesulfovibrio sp.]